MKPTIHSFRLLIGLLSLSALAATAQVTVDFATEGDFDAEFSGGVYTESAAGGVSDSRCVTLANANVTSFDGPQSEFHATGEYIEGSKFTVGVFFKLGSLGTGTGANGQILRMGVTNGGTNNYSTTPFSTIQITNVETGAARFYARDTYGNHTTPFTLVAGQWYYFESTFTRGINTVDEFNNPTSRANITYDMLIAEASSDGTIGTVLDRFSHTMDSVTVVNNLNLKICGAFKGHTTFANGGGGVLDNFYVSKNGISQAPVPGGPPKISSYTRDAVTQQSTLVFASESGADYSLWGCEDLVGWSELIPSIPGTGGDVSVNHTPAGSPPKFFYQIRKD